MAVAAAGAGCGFGWLWLAVAVVVAVASAVVGCGVAGCAAPTLLGDDGQTSIATLVCFTPVGPNSRRNRWRMRPRRAPIKPDGGANSKTNTPA